MSPLRGIVGALLAAATSAALTAQQFARLEPQPAAVQLDHGGDRANVALVGWTASGFARDAFDVATATIEPAGIAAVERADGGFALAPLADGEATLRLVVDGVEACVPVVVRNARAAAAVSFANDVLPVFTHAGCNSGGCHGAAVGKNGFGLSLFAYDPAVDHRVLTRELRGRRIDLAEPERSLVLLKGAGLVPHQGGKRLLPDSDGWRRVREWIAAGAQDDVASAPKLARLEALPGRAQALVGATVPLRVVAHYDGGADRDVTDLAVWSSSDDVAVAVGQRRAEAKAPGEAVLLARFGGLAATARLAVLADDRPWTFPDVAAANFVDQRIHDKLRAMRVAPADVCSDEVFVRRVHLDLIGLLPTPEATRAFVADQAADKHARLVDALLQRPEFADVQAMQWAEVLGVAAERMEAKGAAELAGWLRQAFVDGRPFDAVVRDLLVAEGATYGAPAAGFWLAADQPHLHGEHVAQNLLGIRLQCAQCHNHPFENWTMDDYYGFAAYFAQVGRKRADDGSEWIVWDRRAGEVRNKRNEAIAAPRPLGGAPATIAAGTDRRRALADWLVAPDNRWFAANVANRAFARVFGRGLVEPVDDVRISNPPSHPELLADLAALLVEERFDVRAVYRALCTSRSYQLARHPSNPPEALFAGNMVRRLSAEQLLDAIGAATGAPTKYPGLPLGAPAAAIAGGRVNVRFLDVFGRPARESACTCDRRDEPTLGQALHLVNGDTIAAKVAARDGRLQRLLQAKTPPDALLDELFLAAYCRLPRADERAHLLGLVAEAGDAKAVAASWQDVFWALLNSREFLFQH
ncbi:MAG: DUF1549 domain-containing protein [Planctomycetota bacterium]